MSLKVTLSNPGTKKESHHNVISTGNYTQAAKQTLMFADVPKANKKVFTPNGQNYLELLTTPAQQAILQKGLYKDDPEYKKAKLKLGLKDVDITFKTREEFFAGSKLPEDKKDVKFKQHLRSVVTNLMEARRLMS